MLPKYHHRADREFIKSSLGELPPIWRKQVVDHYSSKYSDVYFNEPNENKRENLARKTANAWLRGYVAKYKARNLQKPSNSG